MNNKAIALGLLFYVFILLSQVGYESDVISTVFNYRDYIGHYHQAGVPGRHEIDETQGLNYRAIMNAIVTTGFKGFVAKEFIPAGPIL